jgi:hypothetical protein
MEPSVLFFYLSISMIAHLFNPKFRLVRYVSHFSDYTYGA